MGWELWHDDGGYASSYGHIGFFCNTADVSFGPVTLVGCGFDKGRFYELWEKSGLLDPRIMKEGDLWSPMHRIANLIDYSTKIKATFAVFKDDALIFEKDVEDDYDVSGLSPFQPELEALSEEHFDLVDSLIEELNTDLLVDVLTNDEGKVTTEGDYPSQSRKEDYHFKVTVNYKVVDV